MIGTKFTFKNWSGEPISYTAGGLHERIMRDSRSDYNWIAPASQLVKAITQPNFPLNYAHGIEMAILNCFANLELKEEEPGQRHREPTDDDAVYFCYNALAGVSDRAESVRQKYLAAVLEAITRFHFRGVDFDHYGPTYHKICDEWKRLNFEHYSLIAWLDFKKLRKYLNDEFDRVMKEAEKNGAFKKDAENRLEEMRAFWSTLNQEEA